MPQPLLRQADAPRPARPPAARLPQAQGQVRVLRQRVHRWSLRGKPQTSSHALVPQHSGSQAWTAQRAAVSFPALCERHHCVKAAGETDAHVRTGQLRNNMLLAGRRKIWLSKPGSFSSSSVCSGPHGPPPSFCSHRSIKTRFGFDTGITRSCLLLVPLTAESDRKADHLRYSTAASFDFLSVFPLKLFLYFDIFISTKVRMMIFLTNVLESNQ